MKDNNPELNPQCCSYFVNYKATEQLAQISWLNIQAVTPVTDDVLIPAKTLMWPVPLYIFYSCILPARSAFL